ncbi:MAG: PAS domain S-box protein [Patescibacteria group bacterium]|jgi:PAS domain S-box-containing protein
MDNQLFAQLFGQSPEAIFIEDLNGKILDCNTAATKLLGYKKAELLQLTIKDLVLAKAIAKHSKLSKELLRKKEISIEAFSKRRDGTLVPVEVDFKLVSLSRKKLILALARDISHHKKIENELTKERNQLFEYLQVSGVMMVAIDNSGKVTMINRKGCEILGYKREKIIGKNWFDNFIPIRFRKQTKVVFKKVINGQVKSVDSFKNPILNAKGQERMIAWRNTVLKDATGKIYASLSSGEDVTDYNDALKKRNESNEKYSSIVEKTSDAIQILSPNGQVLFVNHAWLTKMGYSRQASLKLNVFKDLIDPDTLKHCQEKFANILRGKSLSRMEITYRKRDGKKIFFEGNAVPKIEDKKVVSIICILRDVTERRVNEQILSKNEKRYRITAEKTGQLIYEYDVKSGKIFWAGAIKKNTGYTEKEFAKNSIKDWSAMIHPDDRKRVNETLAKALKKIGKFETNYRFRQKNGNYIEIEDRGIFVKGVNGKTVVMYGSMEDITERKKAEEKIERNEELLRTINNSLPLSMVYQIIRQKNGKRAFTYLSDTVRSFYGISPAQGIKNSALIYDRVHKDDRDRVFREEEQAQKKYSNFKTEVRVIGPNKKVRWSYFISTPTKLLDGTTRWNGVETDITEYKKIQEKLKESEEKYLNLVEGSNDGVVIISDGKVRFANHVLAEMAETSVEEARNRSILSFIAPEYRKFVLDRNRRRQRGEHLESIYQFDLLSKSGKRIPVEANASMIMFENKPASMAVIRDISKAKELDKLKTDFISTASHQLRTPLTGIKWFTELLLNKKAGALTEKQTDFLQQVHLSNERMVKLVDDLLSVAHIDSSEKFRIVNKKEDLMKIIREGIVNLEGMAESKKIKIIEEEGCPPHLIVSIDREKISQVFQNIVSNAIKYSPEKSIIKVDCELKEKEVVFSCSDHGVGIPKHQQNKVFQRFFRADNIMGTETGTGLGLYIAKNIVERHKGKIWFKSIEGKGTTFYVLLPIK